MSALRAYIGDRPRDWDLYTIAITYAYKCQLQTSTDLAPFDLVFSKPPGPIAMQAQTAEPTMARDFTAKWKIWLEKSLKEASKHFSSEQERYNRNYDKRLRKNDETIKLGD